MPQVTIYLPEDVLQHARREARRLKLSLSAYMSSLATRAASPPTWSEEFLSLFGSCPDLEEPSDPPPAPVESL